MGALVLPIRGDVVKRSDCIIYASIYGSTTKGDAVKRTDCILVYEALPRVML